MRLAVLMLVAGMLLAGCSSASKKTESAGKKPRQATAVIVGGAPPNGREADRLSVRPVDALSGRVIAVRPQLRFVIVDFANNRLPKLDQMLFVYRLDQKVAELKVSGPYLGTTVAADVVAGDAQQGDVVKPQ